jgi:hypothetical protein
MPQVSAMLEEPGMRASGIHPGRLDYHRRVEVAR